MRKVGKPKGSRDSPEGKENKRLAAIKRAQTPEGQKKLADMRSKIVITQQMKIKIGLANKGENNGQWKGDNVGYTSLHQWVAYNTVKPELCEICQLVPPYDLANKSGKYLRDLSDWQWLCRKCHMESDGRLLRLAEYHHNRRKQ